MHKVLVFSCALIASASLGIAQEAQTLKERLSDKASDNQRVDNCKVAPDRHGTLPRPDCPKQPLPRETPYFGDPFEPGPSRAQWVERMP